MSKLTALIKDESLNGHLCLRSPRCTRARTPFPGWGCPFPVPFFFALCVPALPPGHTGFLFLCVPLFFFVALFPLCPSIVSGFLWFPAPGALGLGALFLFPHPPRLVFFFFFLFSSVVRPRCLWLSLVSGPGCPGLWRYVLFVLLVRRFSAPRALSLLLCFLPGRSLLPGGCCPPRPPPSPFESLGFRRCRSVPFLLLFLFLPALLPPAGSALVGGSRRLPPTPTPTPSLVCFAGIPLLGSVCALAAFVFPARPFAAPWWLLPPRPPPSPFVSRGFRRWRSVPFLLLFLFLPALLPPAGSALVGGSRRLPPTPTPTPSLVCFAGIPLLGSACALAAFVFPARPFAAPWWLLPPPRPPPSPFVSCGFRRFHSVPFVLLFLFLPALLQPAGSALVGGSRRLPPTPTPTPSLVCFAGIPLLGSACALAAFVFPARPLAAPWWLLLPPPPTSVSRGFRRCRAVLRCFSFAALLLPACLALVGDSRCLLPPPPPPPAVCFVGLPLLGSLCALAAFT